MIKVTTFLIACVGFLLLTGCEPEADLFKQFTMRKGEHFSNSPIVQSLQSNTLAFDAQFDASAIYDFREQGFQDSKNKLLGFSDCNSMHHENSARFAWQWFNDRLEIFAYCYVNGQRVEKFVGVVNMDEINSYTLSVKGDNYIFQLNHEEPVYIERGNVCNVGVYYMLWPYFGGTLPAPHDVTIKVRVK